MNSRNHLVRILLVALLIVLFLSSDIRTQAAESIIEQDSIIQVLPELKILGLASIRNQGDFPVFTGPGPSYYRSASGKGAISNGQRVNVYGRIGNYILVEYSTILEGESITRFAYASVDHVNNGGSFDNLDLGSAAISIDMNARLIDAPSVLRSGFSTIEIDRLRATALAYYVDDAKNEWIYFESEGYSSVNGFVLPVRGFVLARDVTYR